MTEEVSTETFLKTATLSVLARAYPCKLKTSNGNFKMSFFSQDSVIMKIMQFLFLCARKMSLVLQACTLILPLCRPDPGTICVDLY